MTENPVWGDDWGAVRSNWLLDPAVTFLNHGSFGACPKPVLDAQTALRTQMERQPVDFLGRRLEGLLAGARERVAAFVNADPSGLVFVPNATTAVSTVLASIDVEPGGEILTTDHAYPAVRKAIERTCELSGARSIVAPIPLPLPAVDEVTERVVSRICDRTRLLVVDHVTSPTGVILPVAGIVAAAHDLGVPVLVDAAHAPGMVPVDVEALGADFWTGNFHKWCCAPKGAAALVIAPQHREIVHPLVTSHGLGEGLRSEFDWQGTNDPTAWLATPVALDFMDALGWDRVRAHNHALVTLGRDIVAASAEASIDDVPDDAIGSMAIVPLPAGSFRSEEDADGSSRKLLAEHHVEVAAVWWKRRSFLRLSAQVYNAPADYERLAEALPSLVGSRS